jgi:hypothetical protein
MSLIKERFVRDRDYMLLANFESVSGSEERSKFGVKEERVLIEPR